MVFELETLMYQRLIPSILISNERLVKGVRFDNYLDAGKPSTTARAHNHQGADEIIVSDILASRKDKLPNFKILKEISKEVFMPLTFFGGINSLNLARECMDLGADKIGLNSTAIENPSLINMLSRQFGSQSIVIGIDAIKIEGVYYLYDHCLKRPRQDINLLKWVNKAVSQGCGEIRLMSVSKEGTKEGYDFDLYKLVRGEINIPIILEGGSGTLNDIEEAFELGINGVAMGTQLVFADNNLLKIKKHLLTKGKNIRDK